jgi:hypothetical protein
VRQQEIFSREQQTPEALHGYQKSEIESCNLSHYPGSPYLGPCRRDDRPLFLILATERLSEQPLWVIFTHPEMSDGGSSSESRNGSVVRCAAHFSGGSIS